MSHSFRHSRQGFSTLMALGTIGVLLILVTGLASTYIRENRLSRTSYDEVIAYANAEGMFEYAMLKIRNHREGFADLVDNSVIDGKILVPLSERSRGLKSAYEIIANSTDERFLVEKDKHLIVPLFSAYSSVISGTSKNPNPETGIEKVKDLSVTLGTLSWTIVAMSGSQSIGLTGEGDITSSKIGTIRHKTSQCYHGKTGDEIACALFDASRGDEELEYFYDQSILVKDFVERHSDPYLMIFNPGPGSENIHIVSTTPFSLPTLSVRAEAQKNDSVQVFEFTEDKSRYYDALKYGVYNAD